MVVAVEEEEEEEEEGRRRVERGGKRVRAHGVRIPHQASERRRG